MQSCTTAVASRACNIKSAFLGNGNKSSEVQIVQSYKKWRTTQRRPSCLSTSKLSLWLKCLCYSMVHIIAFEKTKPEAGQSTSMLTEHLTLHVLRQY